MIVKFKTTYHNIRLGTASTEIYVVDQVSTLVNRVKPNGYFNPTYEANARCRLVAILEGVLSYSDQREWTELLLSLSSIEITKLVSNLETTSR